MTTTIQIDDEIKKRLFEIKLDLERQKTSAVSYNEIIKFLLKNQTIYPVKRINMKDFRRFEAILSDSVLGSYYKEKKKNLIEKSVELH